MFREDRLDLEKVPTEFHYSAISFSKWVPGPFDNHHYLNTESNAAKFAATVVTVHRRQVQLRHDQPNKQLRVFIDLLDFSICCIRRVTCSVSASSEPKL